MTTLTSSIARRTARPLAVALLLGMGALMGVAHADTLPPVRTAPTGVEYISGGVGSDEAHAMQQAATRWPASFEFAVKDGAKADFAANVHVTVQDARTGATVLHNVKADGPFMAARLAPGVYRVTASLDGKALQRQIDVGAKGPAHAVFMWPAGTDMNS
ncbi:carboxypeptidase-like regulatory domain-containing protein [Pseudacidovorax intermedius]|uniref:carboxypeptidase-like regulatory domain-containing protein n=1 Tax=Pseudacidovorax intermedius TaxID=433924 RepID=UPI0026F12F09|nr:carboxypeptidase-like regulatory domain-containing protein [Pseudacidovorax intermedius]